MQSHNTFLEGERRRSDDPRLRKRQYDCGGRDWSDVAVGKL